MGMNPETRKQKELVLLQVFFIFVVPIFLLVFGVVPVAYRMIVLSVAMLMMYGIIQYEKIPDSNMGLGNKNFKKSILPYFVFTILGLFALEYLAKEFNLEGVDVWYKSIHLLYLFIPVSLLQEIAYRGFLFHKLRVLSHKRWVVIGLNAILFTLIHMIYPDPELMIPLAFATGIGFAVMYEFFPNLILISIAHSILNFYAILHGFFLFKS